METYDKNEPSSLPPNYLSLADLQQRWIKQQQEQQKTKSESQKLIQEPIPEKKKEEVCETQKPDVLPSQGKIGAKDVKKRRGNRKWREKDQTPESQLLNECESQIAEICETQKPNLLPSQGKVAVKDVKKKRGKQQYGAHNRERNLASGDGIGGKDETPESQLPIQEQIAEKEKKVCETQKPNVLPSQGKVRGKDVERNLAPGDGIGNPESQFPKLDSNPNFSNRRNFGIRKGVMEYRLVKSNPEPKPSKIEAAEAEIDGGEKPTVNKQKKTKKNKKKKPEKDNPVKGGGESTVKMDVGDRTVGIEEKLMKELPVMEIEEKLMKELPVPVPVRRDGRRSRDVIERGRRSYHGHGRDEYREVSKGGGESAVKMDVGDRTVEIEEKLKELPVMEIEEEMKKLPVSVWRRDGGRSRDVIERRRRSYHGHGRDEYRKVWKGTVEIEEKLKEELPVTVWRRDVIERGRRAYHGYGRDECREVWKGKREDGLKWVKKGEIVDNSK